MSRINSSILWDYFDKTNLVDKKAKCRVCGDSYSYKGTTGNLKAHLKKKAFRCIYESCYRAARYYDFPNCLSKSDYCRRFICNTVNIGYNNYVSKPNRLNFNSSESNSFTPTSRKTTRYRKIWRH